MPAIGETGVSFDNVSREWRCKYAMDADGTPLKSATLKAAQALLEEYLPTLKALPKAEVKRVVCGGCGDFKVIVKQPLAEHDAWKASGFAPEEEFLAKLKAIEGASSVEAQEYTDEVL
ncbi:hypothetical protein AB1Y20_014577 [Prymnesium parvum]|uniref:Uncharacterized protein n=1 Tax=Prymnesium parvum TaxID=97485 RepID=A0AB34IEK0_PRYPA|mmetsp:Transcript_14444/g.36099  ORF Transcript_14444/g.36099 Transcript_14444/m.36099 type:complete len:118 (+) Transcript_14444:63-416(+)